MKPEVVLLLLLFIAKATTLELEINQIDGITSSRDDNLYSVYMTEEMEVPILLAHFDYAGTTDPTITFLGDDTLNSSVGVIVEKLPAEDRWSMSITLRQDYETQPSYYFDLSAGAQTVVVLMILQNINDNNPIVQVNSPTCEIKEHSMSESDCIFTIFDADGHMPGMTWTLGENNQDFEFIYTSVTINDTKEMTLSIKPLRELDYEQRVLYIMDWTVFDAPILSEDETLSGTTRIVVEVIDIADTNPIWLRIFASAQFEELTSQEFQVEARDGDLGIDDQIFYTIETEWDEYISVDRTTGLITVQPISRDEHEREIFTFEITACEENMPGACTSQDITFFVMDLNNQVPEITVNVTAIEIPENFYDDLPIEIYANDLDTGENAMYDITLTSTGNFRNAFTIAPSSGYQNTNIFLYVTNYMLLDYDRDESWREFTLQLTTRDRTTPYNSDTKLIVIRLTNWNDETPEFTGTEDGGYSTDIEETLPINEFVLAVTATDADFGDKIRYSLLGTFINRILTIDEDSGIITTKVNGAFDYETQEEVIFQVQAIDTLGEPYNSAIAQITINVLDVNDETPVISIGPDRIEVPENMEDGTVIVDDTSDFITAIDYDQSAVLEFDIEWDNSYATKTGRRLTDEEFGVFKNCIIIEGQEIPSTGDERGKSIRAILKIHDVNPENTPDYEVFDVLYLRVTVTDTDQANENTAAVTVPIYITNVNDVSPVFEENTITAMKNVMEESAVGTPIGIIIATDVDSEEIYYSLHSEEHDGLVGITDFGELYVAGNIDADEPPLYEMVFTVTASDGEFSTSRQIVIKVNDINDNAPIFIHPIENNDFPINEKEIQDYSIVTFIVEDHDRSEPNNVVDVRFSTSLNSNLRFYFNIVDGQLVVSYLNDEDKLDRDNAIPGIVNTIRVTAFDAAIDLRFTELVFTVTLQDINDQYPIIQILDFEASESYTKDTLIAELKAEDKDEAGTPNSEIDFNIIRIETEYGDEMLNDIFQLNNIKHEEGTAELRAGIDLENYHGRYLITIETNDFGDIPLKYSNTITVVVNKYNFNPPKFIPPTDGSRKILLRKALQPIRGQLYLYNDQPLDDIVATDQQNDKYSILFSIITNTDDNVFEIVQIGDRTARLELTTSTDDLNGIYVITLRAQAVDGMPELPTDISLTIQFVDSTAEPTFDINTQSITFKENATGLVETFEEASFVDIADELINEYIVYYIIIGENPGGFEIEDNTVNKISVVQPLDKETVDSHTVQIQASRSSDGVANPQEESLLILSITVEDVNDNPPNFESSIYYGTILSSTATGTSILTVHATDLDVEDTLRYSIESYETIPPSISSQNPFLVDPSTGQVSSNMEVPDTAEGYFLFNVHVTDEFHNHSSNVQIYIVSELHRVEFVFRNDFDTVNTVRSQITSVLIDQFGYNCIIETIVRNTDDDGNAMDDEVIVRVHFIDPQSNEPIYKTTIESLANNIQVFGNLMNEFLRYDLVLLRFLESSSTTDNMEDVLRAWLIGISIVLGTLCILLLVAFILKTRSLTKRLNKLSVIRYGSQESGLNRKAAPTTNKHAIEGSNPAYSEEKIKAPENEDAMSVGSGDSDLIGVENNPEFDHKYEKKNGNVISY